MEKTKEKNQKKKTSIAPIVLGNRKRQQEQVKVWRMKNFQKPIKVTKDGWE